MKEDYLRTYIHMIYSPLPAVKLRELYIYHLYLLLLPPFHNDQRLYLEVPRPAAQNFGNLRSPNDENLARKYFWVVEARVLVECRRREI